MTKRLSFALRLFDVCLNRPLMRSEAEVFVNGERVRCEYKTGGYFVVCDLPEGEHTVEIRSFMLQTVVLSLTVDYSPEITSEQRTQYICMNPSKQHPQAAKLPSISGCVNGTRSVFVLRERAALRIAEDKATMGSKRLKLFGAVPTLPATFRIMDKRGGSETVMISGFDGEEYILARPLEYSHARSVEVVPLIEVSCNENGGFFFVLPPDFKADKGSGEIIVNIFAWDEKSSKSAEIKAAPRGITELGELKLKKESWLGTR